MSQRERPLSKVDIFFGVVFVVGGLWLAYAGISQYLTNRHLSQHGTTINAEVLITYSESRKGRDPHFTKYKFEVGEHAYGSDCRLYASEADPISTVAITYDPSDPNVHNLTSHVGDDQAIGILLTVLGIIAPVFWYQIYRRNNRIAQRIAATPPSS